MSKLLIAIVDYQMGNLFSVLNACEKVGLQAVITSRKEEVEAADAVILPGVGAFGDAIRALKRLHLVESLEKIAIGHKPLVGICLGMQLMMTESFEFGHHQGLGFFQGKVVRFEEPRDEEVRILKVPEVQWSRVFRKRRSEADPWAHTILDGISNGEYMYFVHSYYCVPDQQNYVLSTSNYGNVEYCSTLSRGNIFACQYHPERSGLSGLKMYENLAKLLKKGMQ